MSTGPYDLSPKQAAERLGVSVPSIKRWADSGQLTGLRTPGGWWRFSEEDLRRFVERQATGGTPAEATA